MYKKQATLITIQPKLALTFFFFLKKTFDIWPLVNTSLGIARKSTAMANKTMEL